MPLRADGRIETPEDSYPSGTVGAMGDIRASILSLVASSIHYARKKLQLLTQATGLTEQRG